MYRYYCIMRPPAPGTIPKGVETVCAFIERRYIPEINRMAWGYVEYYRKLTLHEVFDYELIMQPNKEQE